VGADLPRRFAAHLHRSGLLPDDAPVLVALSGGLDSVVLLHLLRLARPAQLQAAHFDHAMRPDSAADADWVRGLCRAWGVPLHAARAQAALASEAAARAARYAFLEDAATRAGDAWIATGHHLDDQAETVLFRAARGAGLRGLRGILPRRGRIVRPLLPFTRAELKAYAGGARLRWREDPTNASPAYARNRIRASVLPELERIVPGTSRALARLAQHAAAADHAWDAVLDGLLDGVLVASSGEGVEVATARLLAYPSEIQSRILRHLLRRHGFAPGWAGTRAAVEFINAGASGSRLRLSGGIELQRAFDRILVRRHGQAPRPADRPLSIAGNGAGQGEVVVGGRPRMVCWGGPPAAGAEAGAVEAFDPAAVRFPLQLRGWRPGDRIHLAGGTKKLKKLFTERRVARTARMSLPVLADASGRVLWVVGLARAATARPLPGQPALHVTVNDVGQ
jgi:tRNA(Ile)-lysidine synthase